MPVSSSITWDHIQLAHVRNATEASPIRTVPFVQHRKAKGAILHRYMVGCQHCSWDEQHRSGKELQDHLSGERQNWRKTTYGKRAVCDCAADRAVYPRRTGFYRGPACQEGNRAQIKQASRHVPNVLGGGSLFYCSFTTSNAIEMRCDPNGS